MCTELQGPSYLKSIKLRIHQMNTPPNISWWSYILELCIVHYIPVIHTAWEQATEDETWCKHCLDALEGLNEAFSQRLVICWSAYLHYDLRVICNIYIKLHTICTCVYVSIHFLFIFMLWIFFVVLSLCINVVFCFLLNVMHGLWWFPVKISGRTLYFFPGCARGVCGHCIFLYVYNFPLTLLIFWPVLLQ